MEQQTIHIEILRGIEGLSKIKAAWEGLCDDLGGNVSVFASFVWYETWWRYFSDRATLHVITMWKADKLVGIAPLMRRKAILHRLPVTVVGFIENSNSLHNDFLVLPAFREFFLQEVIRYLFEQPALWDIIIFKHLPVTSANYGTLVSILNETGKKWQEKPTCFNSPYLIPSGNWTDYLASRATRTRKSLRNIQNRINKTGEVSVRNIRTWEEFLSVKEDVFSVAKQSWTGEIGDSLASPPLNKAFFEDLARSAAAKGWLSLWTLQLNGKMIAIEFHLRAYGKEHAMRGHYLPEFASLSPGTYLEMQILKNTFEEPDKVQKYDFGASFEGYKRKWTDTYVPHCAISVFNNKVYSRFVSFQETKTTPFIDRLINKIRKTGAEAE